MVDFQFHNHLEMLRVEWGDEHELLHPTYSQLASCLDLVRHESSVNHCVDCSVRLLGEVVGQLHLMRVNDIEEGRFLGWLAQLSSESEFNSFLLADTASTRQDSRYGSTLVELLGCHECVNSRCILPHAKLMSWIRHALMGSSGVKQFRWIDFGLAMRVL